MRSLFLCKYYANIMHNLCKNLSIMKQFNNILSTVIYIKKMENVMYSRKNQNNVHNIKFAQLYTRIILQSIAVLIPIFVCTMFIMFLYNTFAYNMVKRSFEDNNMDNASIISNQEYDNNDISNQKYDNNDISNQKYDNNDDTNNQITDSRLLLLVNKSNKIPDDYDTLLHELQNGNYVAEIMYEDLKEMWFDGEEQNPGYSFNVCSGYRSYEKQEYLLNNKIQSGMDCGYSYEEAYNKAILEISPPGYSEHQTGLAVDIVSESYQILDETQELTPENKWLQEHCYEYGFILRYPKGKEDVTGYNYEAWHFRYVGRETAKEIHNMGITLEEYLNLQK